MGKRVISFFCFYIFLFLLLTGWLMNVTFTEKYVRVGNSQSLYTLTIYSTRGKIYDRNMNVLAGGASEYKAVIKPSKETTAILLNYFDSESLGELEDKLKGNRPFVISVSDSSLRSENISVIKCEKRYSENNPIASNVVGYLGSDGNGVSGIEKAYNDVLENYSGAYKITFRVNALGNGLAGEPIIRDTVNNSAGGVVLTIDSSIQLIAQIAANEYLKSGSIVIMEPYTGEILACVSSPQYNQNHISDYLDSEEAALVNKALSSYDAGSVFKLVVAAAALESGYSDFVYCCEGAAEIGNKQFKCSRLEGHGGIGLEQAVALSCNTYFIALAEKIGYEKILSKAKLLGFGEKIELGTSYYTSTGNLPKESELKLQAGLANFSFGQGSLLVNPIQIAALVSCIANGGEYVSPYIVLKTVNSKREIVSEWAQKAKYRAISEKDAESLRKYMESVMSYGTGKSAASQRTTSAAKTGSAETGVVKNGKTLTRGWFAGYFPADAPQFVCVVLEEDAISGTVSAGPCFKFLSERLTAIYGK